MLPNMNPQAMLSGMMGQMQNQMGQQMQGLMGNMNQAMSSGMANNPNMMGMMQQFMPYAQELENIKALPESQRGPRLQALGKQLNASPEQMQGLSRLCNYDTSNIRSEQDMKSAFDTFFGK